MTAPKTDPFSGTKPVESRFQFDVTALERWMRDHIKDFSTRLVVQQFNGGQSNPTYLLSDGSLRWVLRRKPPGKLLASAHAIDREYRVLAALVDSDVPVARAHGLCVDESVIGTAFYVMDYVEGRIFWDPTLPDCVATERTAIFEEMNRVLAELHRLDHAAHGLADYGRPGNYFARQVDRWSRQYRQAPAPRIEAMERLIEWLPQHLPAVDEAVLVHGDYRIANLIFHPREPRIIAVLDWELSTVGHPLADLAYHCLPWHLPAEDGGSLARFGRIPLGVPSEQQYVEAYCRHIGRAVIDPRDWTFCLAFSLFRNAAILHGISGRVTEGNAAGAEAEGIGRGAPTMADLAWRTIEDAGARR